MTELVEEITIKIVLNHCVGDSVALGGPNDLRAMATKGVADRLPQWLADRIMSTHHLVSAGVVIGFENTGLYEVPEKAGGDN